MQDTTQRITQARQRIAEALAITEAVAKELADNATGTDFVAELFTAGMVYDTSKSLAQAIRSIDLATKRLADQSKISA
jgi:predicted proteasome-type protease